MRPSLLLVVLAWLSCPASPCPSLEQSIASSDLVAEVSLVARSRAERGHYFATFRTDKILQSKDSDLSSKYLRLKLETKSRQSRVDSRCNFTTRVKPNNKYLLMVKKDTKSNKAGGTSSSSPPNYSLTSPPLRLKRKLVGEVQRILCPHCNQTGGRGEAGRVRVRRGRLAGGEERERTNTRLSCSARGNPPPTLYWTMDGKIVKNTHQTRIITKNLSKFLRKSVLKLKPSVTNRSLRLQCHAYNEFGHTSKVKMTKPVKKRTKSRAKSRARSLTQLKGIRSNIGFKPKGGLLAHNQHRVDRERSRSPLYSSECPIPDYCMNGGRCRFYSIIGEQSCHCEKGYHGQRCERKYVNSHLEGPRMSDKFPMCLLGIAHYPCP